MNGHATHGKISPFPSVTDGVSEPESSGGKCDDKSDEEEEYSDGLVVLDLDEEDKQATVRDDRDDSDVNVPFPRSSPQAEPRLGHHCNPLPNRL
jgi:hypothetical protein